MDMFTIISFIVYGYGMYRLGRYTVQQQVKDNVRDQLVDDISSKISIPVCVIEQVDGSYYVYEKDTPNFLAQSPTLEELPEKLLSNKISLALLMYPEKSATYWCINGKLKVINEG